jgi:hypothetical protein
MAYSLRALRESKYTSFRIHQHIEKNSFPLKEVLTQEAAHARCVIAMTARCAEIRLREMPLRPTPAIVKFAGKACAADVSSIHA